MEDVKKLISIFPNSIREKIDNPEELIEVVMDLGRPLEMRYLKDALLVYDNYIISYKDIDYVLENVGVFGEDNRAGIDTTLHRISRIQNRAEETIGLTCRVGKPFIGSIDLVEDLIKSGSSILIMGKPGAGKTSLLRDAAHYLSEQKRVVIVDTSNEIAGDGNIPHKAVGRSRRLQIPYGKSQDKVMIEAVENHMPEVIVIDEISTMQEAQAARSIAQRGVQLLATAHGKTIQDIISNPPLVDLLGGINVVTLSDEVMRVRGLDSKTQRERKTEPVFDCLVEILNFNEVLVHTDVRSAVDSILSEEYYSPEERRRLNGKVVVVSQTKARGRTRKW